MPVSAALRASFPCLSPFTPLPQNKEKTMSAIYSLVLDFDEESESGTSCSGLKLEVPEEEVSIGDAVRIMLWGPLEYLEGWRLLRGVESLGPGELVSESGEGQAGAELVEQVNFAGASEAQLEWPVHGFTRKDALTELLTLNQDGTPSLVKPRGWSEQENAYFERKGYSCVRVRDKTALYGALRVTYRRLRWARRWLWTVPADAYGDVWFFLYDGVGDAPYKRFSISLPELASTVVETKNIAIRALDSSTRTAIPNATIWLDGLRLGVTDAEGLLHADQTLAGEHAFKAEAEGYLSTDEDGLSNESITV
jgi:hypothetical protein